MVSYTETITHKHYFCLNLWTFRLSFIKTYVYNQLYSWFWVIVGDAGREGNNDLSIRLLVSQFYHFFKWINQWFRLIYGALMHHFLDAWWCMLEDPYQLHGRTLEKGMDAFTLLHRGVRASMLHVICRVDFKIRVICTVDFKIKLTNNSYLILEINITSYI